MKQKTADGDCFLSSDFLQDLGQHKLIYFPGVFPGGEVAGFEVVFPISQDHFDSDSNHLRVIDEDSAVVEGSFVEDWTAEVDQDAIGDSRNNEVFDDIPGVKNGVVLEEVVFT